MSGHIFHISSGLGMEAKGCKKSKKGKKGKTLASFIFQITVYSSPPQAQSQQRKRREIAEPVSLFSVISSRTLLLLCETSAFSAPLR